MQYISSDQQRTTDNVHCTEEKMYSVRNIYKKCMHSTVKFNISLQKGVAVIPVFDSSSAVKGFPPREET